MSVIRSLDEGVKAIQAGQLEEGARLLRYALRDENIQGELRATALTWLADATRSRAQKIELYEQALQAAPGYDLAQQRLAKLLQPGGDAQPAADVEKPASLPDLPPPPEPVYQRPPARPPAAPAQPQTVPAFSEEASAPASDVQTSVGVLATQQRRGSGFFVAANGLIATTRYIVGPLEHVTVELEPGNQVPGRVVRSFPEADVAFVYVDRRAQNLPSFASNRDLPANAQITVAPYGQPRVRGQRRETGRALAQHLFPTDIAQLPDAGGAPVFDAQQQVVGMITRNISGASTYVYGVHISTIREYVNLFMQEMRTIPNRIYCVSCGSASSAGANGGYYCEVCGTVMPHASNQQRLHNPQMMTMYGQQHPTPCTVCGAQVGFYNHHCLRCGQVGDTRRF